MSFLVVMVRCRYLKSVSVFRYTGRFFKSVRYFVFGISKYRDIGSIFSVFHFTSRADPKILLPVSSRTFIEDPCPRRPIAAAVRTSADLPVGDDWSELSSLDASNPEELSP